MIDVRLERILALSLVQRAEVGGDTATSGRFATPSYYCLISVLPPARCFQEPVSNGDIGRLNVLSVYTVYFTQLFTKHCWNRAAYTFVHRDEVSGFTFLDHKRVFLLFG